MAAAAPLGTGRREDEEPPGRTEFLRGIFHQDRNGQLRVRTTGPQGSGILSSMADANCLIEIVPDQPGIAVGERVWIHPLQGRLA
ncbi:hypothetical protein ACTG11_24000 [Aeromonas hydrophila]